jgi:hypothetical protein
VTTVFFERGAILLAQPDEQRRRPPSWIAVPGVSEQIRHLTEAGIDVTLIGPDIPDEVREVVPDLTIVDELPSGPPPDSWLVTTDPAWCERPRPAGLHTILIGPRQTPGPRRSTYCDIVARDLSAAVMDILTRQVMGTV